MPIIPDTSLLKKFVERVIIISFSDSGLCPTLPDTSTKILKFLGDVHSVGFEPTTDGFEIRHSIQLNYECLFTYLIYIGFCVIFLGKIFYFIFYFERL